MTRLLTVCLLAVVLVQPSTAGAGLSGVDQRALHRHVLDVANRADVSDVVLALLPHVGGRPFWSNVASVNKAGNSLSQCSQALALGPDVQCVHACDASKVSCDGQCTAGRTACLAQCPGLGFACDYYCRAAFYVCTGNCARTRDTCVGNCPARGGEKQ